MLIRTLAPQERGSRKLSLISTLAVIRGMHQAVLSRATDPVPEVISGHGADGKPTTAPHLAFFPLASVGWVHGGGDIRGLAAALPGDLEAGERRSVLAAIGAVKELSLGRLGRWKLSDPAEPRHRTFRPVGWTGGGHGASVWGTVTPVAYDHHPKSRSENASYEEVGQMIRSACRRIGLPEPVAVAPLPVSPHLSVPASHEFPRLTRKDGSERRHVHAWISFPEPVRGPIALGAGRFRGYGFFRPLTLDEAG